MASLKQANINYETEPITIYDTVHIPPGATIAKEIRFSFGADISDDAKFRSLIKLKEHELTRALLEQPLLCEKLFAPLGLTFPRIWILIEPPAPSCTELEPGRTWRPRYHLRSHRGREDCSGGTKLPADQDTPLTRWKHARSHRSLPSARNRKDGLRPDRSCPHAAQRTRAGERRRCSKLESHTKFLFYRPNKGYLGINEEGI